MGYTGVKIEANGETFEDGSGFEKSDWHEDLEYLPKPKTQYTVGGIPKRSIPTQRFGVECRLIFQADENGVHTDFETFRDFFYNSAIDYYLVTFSHAPLGRSSAILAMNFIDELVIEEVMAKSIEVSFHLVEVLYVLES